MKEMETLAQAPETKKQKGFTLVELVAVIAVLGILAAVALPKFVDVQNEARAAATQAARGSLSSAALMAHAKMLAANSMTVTLGGQTMVMGDWSGHYPKGNVAGFLAGLNSWAGAAADGWTYHGVGDGTAVTIAGGTAGTDVILAANTYAWSPASASIMSGNASGCYVSYADATVAGGVITEPVLTVVTTGCSASGM